MLKIFQYLFIVNIYKRSKRYMHLLLIALLFMVFTSFIMEDLISISSGTKLSFLVTIKWSILFLLLSLVLYSFYKIVKISTSSFKGEKREERADKSKKESLLAKEILSTKSDFIIEKYQRRRI